MPRFLEGLTANAVVAIVVSLTSSLAVAAEGSGIYAGLGVGAAFHNNLNPSTSQIDAGYQTLNLSTITSVNANDVGYKGFVGYQISREFAVEGGYTDLGEVKFTTGVLPGAGSAEISRKVHGWNADVLAFMQLPKNLSAFVRVGGIYSHTTATTSATGAGGAFALRGTKDQWTLKYGLGVNYDVSNRLAIRGELEHYRNLGDITITGEGDVTVVSIGALLKF